EEHKACNDQSRSRTDVAGGWRAGKSPDERGRSGADRELSTVEHALIPRSALTDETRKTNRWHRPVQWKQEDSRDLNRCAHGHVDSIARARRGQRHMEGLGDYASHGIERCGSKQSRIAERFDDTAQEDGSRSRCRYQPKNACASWKTKHKN